jgi:hypothetical protein
MQLLLQSYFCLNVWCQLLLLLLAQQLSKLIVDHEVMLMLDEEQPKNKNQIF